MSNAKGATPEIEAASSEWMTLWERPAGAGLHGVEARLFRGTKYYRAWAKIVLDEEKVLRSSEYEACDQADVDPKRMHHGFIIPELVQDRESAMQEAAAARAMMTPKQRSPKDMQQIAAQLADELSKQAQEYDRLALLAAQQAAYDEAALQAVRPLVHGLALLLSRGSDEEKATLARLGFKLQ